MKENKTTCTLTPHSNHSFKPFTTRAWARVRYPRPLLPSVAILIKKKKKKNLRLSKGWLDRFLQLHSLTIRRTTTVSQRTPADFVEKVCNFVLFTRQLIADQKLTPGTVYGMDETAVRLDPSASTSIAPVGVRDVSIRRIGHDKLRIIVALTAQADVKSAFLSCC